jgi:hypothetical protein
LFQQLSGHSQAVKIHKNQNTIATLVVGGLIEISVVGVRKRMSIKVLDPSLPHN